MTDLYRARERYNALEWVPDGEMGFDPGGREVKDAADALIAALEDENEALKCCGNCGHYSRIAMTATYRCNEDRRMPGQPHSMMPWRDCRFIPNKWTMRERADHD
jgi:hypothetical protein